MTDGPDNDSQTYLIEEGDVESPHVPAAIWEAGGDMESSFVEAWRRRGMGPSSGGTEGEGALEAPDMLDDPDFEELLLSL